MANTENLGVALARGYQIGRSTGGKLSGLGQIIGKVADRLKSQRELGEQLNLLGQTERIKSMYDPQTRMINTLFGGGEGTIPSFSGETPTQDISTIEPDKLRRGLVAKMTGVPYEQMMTEEEKQRETKYKAQEQATIAAEKEKQLNISKVLRLKNIANITEKRFLETSPYGGLITKTGLTPILGMIDVVKSNLQATEAQRTDRAYLDFVKGFRAQLARAMGDVGNLSEPEQKAAMKLVPTLLDSKETGLKKLSNLRDFISTIEATRFESFGNNQSQDISEDDIQFTMQRYGLSRQEVLRRLGQ